MGIKQEFPFDLEGATASANAKWKSRMGKSNGEPLHKQVVLQTKRTEGKYIRIL